MTRSLSNIWEPLTSWDNLRLAYRRCRRRKRYRRKAVAFDFDWETQLLALQRELRDGTYAPGAYQHFFIQFPKRRKISAAPFRDRVVHHALVQQIEPFFDRRFIHDSYACRKGKGTHRALDRAQSFLRRYAYYLKTDIVRFFPNIDHQILLARLERHVRDPGAMELIQRIVASGAGILNDEATPSYFPGDDLFAISRPRGLPIGNLTSQFFANLLLDPLDHFIKERLRVSGYVRYADDLVLFGQTKRDLWEAAQAISGQLSDLRLRLHPHKTQLRPARTGVTFLGFQVFRDGRRLTGESIRRFVRRRKDFQRRFRAGKGSFRHVRQSLRAWQSHVSLANSKGIARELLRAFRLAVRTNHPR
jgi:RNA-directed DNA polymerase